MSLPYTNPEDGGLCPPLLPQEDDATPQDLPALAFNDNILDAFSVWISNAGLVGQERAAKLLFLVMLTRLLDTPVSAVLKGQSSAGKSWVIEKVLQFFPPRAYFHLSTISPMALAYIEEDLSHRMLVIAEAPGVSRDAEYLLRTLLTEGRIVHQTVVKTGKGQLRSLTIKVEGPVGVILTTTRHGLNQENETRMLSIPVDATEEERREIYLANLMPSVAIRDFTAWFELADWLEKANHEVVIPFAPELAQLMPVHVHRQNRDTKALAALIKAHAILHQTNRLVDGNGCIIATLRDYAAVRDLVSDIFSVGVRNAIPDTVRETVDAVKARIGAGKYEPSLKDVAHELDVDVSTASRRVNAAEEMGYLKNMETRKGAKDRIVLGKPMPDERTEILPTADAIYELMVESMEGIDDTAEDLPSLGDALDIAPDLGEEMTDEEIEDLMAAELEAEREEEMHSEHEMTWQEYLAAGCPSYHEDDDDYDDDEDDEYDEDDYH